MAAGTGGNGGISTTGTGGAGGAGGNVEVNNAANTYLITAGGGGTGGIATGAGATGGTGGAGGNATIDAGSGNATGGQGGAGGTALDGLDERDGDQSGRSGWRELVHRLTRIDLGPGKDSRYEQALRARIRTVVGGAFPIAVLNLKGGVGKTAVVEALGSTFAHVRHDRILAVDIDAGDLAERHGRRNPLSMADLLADDTVAEYGDVRAHTYMNSFGLEVLGLPDYARTDWRLDRHGVARAFSILRQHYSVVLVDCPKALNSPEMEAVLPESCALVVVTSTALDAVRKTKTSLEWLSHNGYRSRLKSTVLVINHVEPGRVDNVAAKELEQLSARVAATVVLPFDRHVHDGQQISLDRMSRESRRSYLEMAATLADMFPGRAANRDLRPGSAARPRPI
ncbi:chromosome partitioning ATPase [Mycobacterium bohemicum DSM 44277]|uniref:Chromosome partitioning ATPase n=1 Tax=Mycobacterium bohemicum DSM 44277 TaxID=1236609 RepID=A0A0U0WCJ3_MYCBE|nr:MinD/ParA family protein [Mycobacterium bohemicum]CPR12668.1 chromosome partitioning ATPase [Mycobacterium bohemicum DSM 44277]